MAGNMESYAGVIGARGASLAAAPPSNPALQEINQRLVEVNGRLSSHLEIFATAVERAVGHGQIDQGPPTGQQVRPVPNGVIADMNQRLDDINETINRMDEVCRALGRIV